MKAITISDVTEAVRGRLIRACEEEQITGVRHDSRECGAGDMFVCIKGPNNDGHRFIPQVLQQGCRSLLISDTSALTDEMDVNAILVEDTVYAMGELARFCIRELDPIRVAVTGSVGKTSTRDMIWYVLNEKYRCGRNLKNFNNDVGLPISIFNLEEDTEAVVLEMGMSNFGEIDRLAQIVRPQIGVITNIGVSHMENLGSREGIFRAKMELTKHLLSEEEGGTMVFVYDEEFLNRENTAGDYGRIFVGTDGKSDYILSDIEDHGIDGVSFCLEHDQCSRRFHIPVPGRHNAFNGAVAAAIGERLGLSLEQITAGLEKVQLTGSRLRVLKGTAPGTGDKAGCDKSGTGTCGKPGTGTCDISVIDDTYNASPDSMKAAMKVLQKSECEGRKVAILGEMYELGEREAHLHFGVGVFARSCGIDELIAIGPLAEKIAAGADGGDMKVSYYATKEDFLKHAGEHIRPKDLILVKASRGMHMEEIVDFLTK